MASTLPAPVTRKTLCAAASIAGSVSEMRGTNGSKPASGTPTTSRSVTCVSGRPGNSEAMCASGPSPSSMSPNCVSPPSAAAYASAPASGPSSPSMRITRGGRSSRESSARSTIP